MSEVQVSFMGTVLVYPTDSKIVNEAVPKGGVKGWSVVLF